MKRYQRVVVCLNCPEHAVRILQYAAIRSRLAESKTVYVLRVIDDAAEEPGEDKDSPNAPSLNTPDALERLAAEHFDGHGGEEILCEVKRGSALLETLRFARDHDVDLILLGRHFGGAADKDDEALLARRITRKATCSVLVLPPDVPMVADAIVVPVRDSECSASALEVACGIAASTGAKVTALNVYHVSAGYSRTGTTLDEHRALLEAAAQRECSRLIARVDKHGVEVTSRCVPELDGNPVRHILEEVEQESADLIAIGARGRTGAAGVLLGTITEQLIRVSPVPVLAVKKKGECLGILSALLALAGE